MAEDFIKVKCSRCDKRLKIPSAKSHKKISCPRCQFVFRYVAEQPVVADIVEAEMAAPSDIPVEIPAPLQPQTQQVNHPQSVTGGYWATSGSNHRVAPTKTKKRKSARQSDEEEEWVSNWKSSAIIMMVVGVGASILPFFGLQFRRIRADGPEASIGGLIIGLSGVAFYAYAAKNDRESSTPLLASAATLILLVSIGGYIGQSMKQQQSNSEEPAVVAPDERPGRGGRFPIKQPTRIPRP